MVGPIAPISNLPTIVDRSISNGGTVQTPIERSNIEIERVTTMDKLEIDGTREINLLYNDDSNAAEPLR